MENTCEIQKILDDKLVLLSSKLPIGLFYGKMGVCIYFFHIGRINANKEYVKIGEKLLNEIENEIKSVHSVNVQDGLAGIGLGIHYLIKKQYVKGDVNVILQDIDDEVFKRLSYSKHNKNTDSLSLLYLLYYLYKRCSLQKPGSDSEWLHRELIIQTVDTLYHKYDSSLFEEQYTYRVEYQLPLFLFVLSKIYCLNFYNYRIIRILEEITPKLLSTFPLLHANRLFLLWGISAISEVKEIEGWGKHAELLKRELNINHILTEELKNRNVFFNNGIASVYMLLSRLKGCFSENEITEYATLIGDKIRNSDIWNILKDNPEYFRRHIGLYNGYTGTAIIETLIKR